MTDISSSISYNEKGEFVNHYFVDGSEVTAAEYDDALAKWHDDRAEELAAIQAAAVAERTANEAATASARAKLVALGLTEEEAKAIFGG